MSLSLLRRSVCAVALLGLLLVAVACGDDKGSSSSGSGDTGTSASSESSTSSSSGNKATGKPIKMFIITTIESQFQSLPESVAGAKAAALAISNNGGVKGRPISIDFCDDHGTPAAATACARKAVSEKSDVVQMTTNFSSLIYPILRAAQIPTVGNNMFSPADFTDEDSWPLVPGSNIYHSASPFMVAAAGKKTMDAASLDIATAVQNAKLSQATAPKANLGWKGVTQFPATTTDYAPIVQKLKNAGSEATTLIIAGPSIPPILKAAQQLGFKHTWVSNPTGASAAVLKEAGDLAEGMLVISPLPTADDPKFKGFNEEMDAAGKAGIKDTDKRTTVSEIPWLAVHAVAAIGDTMTDELNGPNLIKALNKGKDIDVAGLITWSPADKGPAQFPRVTNSTVYPQIVKDGKVVPNGDPIDTFKEMGLTS